MFMIPMVIMAIESDTDRAYMTDVYMNHRSLMLKVAWRYTNAPSEVEDIVSESCVSLIQHLDSIRSMEEKTLRSYIVTTVKNKAIDFSRKKKRNLERTIQMADDDIEQIGDLGTFDHKIEVQMEIDMVKQMITALPEREREVLKLKFFEGKETKQISEIMGVAENAVRRYIMRGRNALKAALYEGGTEE